MLVVTSSKTKFSDYTILDREECVDPYKIGNKKVCE